VVLIIYTDFVFDEVNSRNKGLYLVRVNDEEMFFSPIYGNRDIIEDRNLKKDYNYFYSIRKNPIEFELTFCLINDLWTQQKKYDIFNWLVKDKYCEFFTLDKTDRIFYITCIDQGNLMTNGNNEGYITMQFRSLYPYAISPVYTKEYDLAGITSPTIIDIVNLSNVDQYYYPEIEFKLVGDNTNFKLKNLTVNEEYIEFSNLSENESVYINNENKQILSSVENSYPINKMTNKQWLRLATGVNKIEISGKCIFKTRMKFPLYI